MLFPFAQDASRHIKQGTHIGGCIPCRCRLPKHSANHLAPSLCAGTQQNKRRSSPPIEMQDLGQCPCRMMGWNSLQTVQSRSIELGIFLSSGHKAKPNTGTEKLQICMQIKLFSCHPCTWAVVEKLTSAAATQTNGLENKNQNSISIRACQTLMLRIGPHIVVQFSGSVPGSSGVPTGPSIIYSTPQTE